MHPACVHRAKRGAIYSAVGRDENDPSCAVQWHKIYLWGFYRAQKQDDIHSTSYAYFLMPLSLFQFVGFPLLAPVPHKYCFGDLRNKYVRYSLQSIPVVSVNIHKYVNPSHLIRNNSGNNLWPKPTVALNDFRHNEIISVNRITPGDYYQHERGNPKCT